MKFSLKSFIMGAIVATVGTATVFAAGGIKSAEYNQSKVFFDGKEIELSSPMISVVKEGETAFSNYMPVRTVLEAMGYEVEWDAATQAVKINTKGAAAVAPEAVKEASPIIGFWIAETDNYKIQYHFHENGHYHAHTEFHKGEGHEHEHLDVEDADTFADGSYVVSGNAVTIKVENRITDCESKEFKKEIEEVSEIKLTYKFADDGKSWTASVEGFGTVNFVKDVEGEDWVEEHMTHNN